MSLVTGMLLAALTVCVGTFVLVGFAFWLVYRDKNVRQSKCGIEKADICSGLYSMINIREAGDRIIIELIRGNVDE